MMPRFCQLLLTLAIAAGGCATHHAIPATAPAPLAPAATEPSDPKAFLTLDQITPVPHLSAPATQPTTRPSLDALVLYGKARDASAHHRPYTTISDLEQAIALDPTSYDLHFDLAKAYLAVSNVEHRAIPMFEKAAAIDPDHLDLQIDLGRQYLAKGDLVKGLKHLRLALQTSEYAADDSQAAVADLYLAEGLKKAGYDRAALDQYNVLLHRLVNPSLAIRQNPQLAFWFDRPARLYEQIGDLYGKHGAYTDALKAYQAAADDDSDNPGLQARIARTLASLDRRDEALAKAGGLVADSHASPESLVILRDVCGRLKLPNGEADELRKLHEQHPKDQPILFALLDALIARGDKPNAEQTLARAWEASPGDLRFIRRLVSMYRQRDAVEEAARVLIVASARDPNIVSNIDRLWNDLLRPGAANAGKDNWLRLSVLQAMHVAPDAQVAKNFWMSRVAQRDHRDALATSLLWRCIGAVPHFAPAYRAVLAQTWATEDASEQHKITISRQLANTAAQHGDAALGEELRGLALLNQKNFKAANHAFAQAIHHGGNSPDLLLAYALSSRKPGKDPQFESRMWKLLSDYPLYEDGYAHLFRYYAGSDVGSINDALKVLSTWIHADPLNVTARVIAANVAEQLGQARQAEATLLRLFGEDPDDPEVLAGLGRFYTRTNRLDDFIAKLQSYIHQHPEDTTVAGALVQTYAGQKRMPDAIRVVKDTQKAVANDPDRLYIVAGLYAALGEKSSAEDVLQQVILLDPEHAGACNDLGFSWADEGKNLARAEQLIRVAVKAEPDNQSFLDSLGWVLYKRGNFTEASQYLTQAVDPATMPDPVVLDHLGDTLYRLSRSTDAIKQWQRALKGIGEQQRDDLKSLQDQLRNKIQQADDGQRVDVAPVGGLASSTRAKE